MPHSMPQYKIVQYVQVVCPLARRMDGWQPLGCPLLLGNVLAFADEPPD